MGGAAHPNNRRAGIDEEVLRELYVVQELTLAVVASRTSRRFYLWLMALGLTPAKSLTIGALEIPDAYFADFFRGCIDGDGSIVTYVDRYNVKKDPAYVYDRLYVSLTSASPAFVAWIHRRIFLLRGITGHLNRSRTPGRRDMWHLRYAKRDSVSRLRWMYYRPDIPTLARKRAHAEAALSNVTWYRHDLSERDG